ncbi:LysR family transcriptional regulator [Paracoccus saliphilus]|uniref:LysR family transcriptional regulator n=1 Tax=Paracoccus saliphilus TaxID=405559 RepID=A0AA46A430_9RHOB|nr:LysR substrate-binding domain-containing protein [Paracoccus saliphilus]WCR03499.1 LysR family transcriptional regulator [Paracoccus saliphilus]SIS54770.1 LysR family transcriptional regulator, nitrogen assimilation regulatory protein [Paracoccus saliphilus]
MDIRQLRYFLAIVEEGSFSRAAKRLNIAQPALSLHVRKMEETLGTPLLLRHSSGVSATEAGSLLVERARPLLAGFDHMHEELHQVGKQPGGTVRIGLPGTISGILSVPLIAHIHRRHPRIKLIIAEAMSGFVGEWLEEGRIDLGVLYGATNSRQVRLEPLLQEELVILLPTGITDSAPASLATLTSMPLILPSASHGLRRMIQQRMQEAGLTFDPAIEVDSYACIKRLVQDGFGCSVLPVHAVVEEVERGLLQARPFADDRLWRSAYLASHSTRLLSRAATAASLCLREVTAELIGQGNWLGASDVQSTPEIDHHDH